MERITKKHVGLRVRIKRIFQPALGLEMTGVVANVHPGIGHPGGFNCGTAAVPRQPYRVVEILPPA